MSVFKVIENLCYCQTVQNTKVFHAMVVASGKVWSLFE